MSGPVALAVTEASRSARQVLLRPMRSVATHAEGLTIDVYRSQIVTLRDLQRRSELIKTIRPRTASIRVTAPSCNDVCEGETGAIAGLVSSSSQMLPELRNRISLSPFVTLIYPREIASRS